MTIKEEREWRNKNIVPLSCKPGELAYPGKHWVFRSGVNDVSVDYHNGLTKREWFAGMAMQGIVAGRYASNDPKQICIPGKKVMEEALQMADGLIAELAKEKE